MFYAGQEVECIDARPGYATPVSCPFTKGHIYIVTKVFQGCDMMYVNADSRPWSTKRFRSITRRPTDISIFTAMLGPKQKETIDA